MYYLNNDYTNLVFEKLISVDFGENIFIFDDWTKIFNHDKQLIAIFMSKKYELLNIAKIKYYDMIKQMMKIDKLNIGYDELLCYIDKYKIYRHYGLFNNQYNIFNINDVNKFLHDEEIHIKQCYPKIDYDICVKLFFCIISNEDKNIIKINFRKSYTNVYKGSNICIKNNNKQNDYEYLKIIKLEKIVDENIISTNVIYVDDSNKYTNKYMITFDKPIKNNIDDIDDIYVIKSKCFDVKLDV